MGKRNVAPAISTSPADHRDPAYVAVVGHLPQHEVCHVGPPDLRPRPLADHADAIRAPLRGVGQPRGAHDRPLAVARLIAINEENGQLLGAVSDAACGERRHVVYSGPFYAWLHGVVAGLLARASEAGETPPLDVAWLADALLAPLAIDLYLFQRRERGFAPEQLLAGMRQLLAGLQVSTPAVAETGGRGN